MMIRLVPLTTTVSLFFFSWLSKSKRFLKYVGFCFGVNSCCLFVLVVLHVGTGDTCILNLIQNPEKRSLEEAFKFSSSQLVWMSMFIDGPSRSGSPLGIISLLWTRHFLFFSLILLSSQVGFLLFYSVPPFFWVAFDHDHWLMRFIFRCPAFFFSDLCFWRHPSPSRWSPWTTMSFSKGGWRL